MLAIIKQFDRMYLLTNTMEQNKMTAITITAPIEPGGVAVFKINILLDDAFDAISMIESVDCVKDGEEMGLWEIV